MYLTDLEVQYARERYRDELVAARISRLIRAAQPKQAAARPVRDDALIVRVFDALRPRRPVRI